jgi:hypothetical protein
MVRLFRLIFLARLAAVRPIANGSVFSGWNLVVVQLKFAWCCVRNSSAEDAVSFALSRVALLVVNSSCGSGKPLAKCPSIFGEETRRYPNRNSASIDRSQLPRPNFEFSWHHLQEMRSKNSIPFSPQSKSRDCDASQPRNNKGGTRLAPSPAP